MNCKLTKNGAGIKAMDAFRRFESLRAYLDR